MQLVNVGSSIASFFKKIIYIILAFFGFNRTPLQKEQQHIAQAPHASLYLHDFFYPNQLTNTKNKNFFIQEYAKTWLSKQYLIEQAQKEKSIDLKEINKKARNYRDELIFHEYIAQKIQQKISNTIDEKTIQAYYKAHQQNFLSSDFFLKASYIIVPKHQAQKAHFSRLLQTTDTINRLQLKNACNQYAHKFLITKQWIPAQELIDNYLPHKKKYLKSFLSTIQSKKVYTEKYGKYVIFIVLDAFITPGQTQPLEQVSQDICYQIHTQRKEAAYKHILNNTSKIILKKSDYKLFFIK